VQLDQDGLGLAPAQCERRMADAHHEGIAAGACLGEDLDVFPAHEAEFEKPPLERKRGREVACFRWKDLTLGKGT
jgi:hypothetical protein